MTSSIHALLTVVWLAAAAGTPKPLPHAHVNPVPSSEAITHHNLLSTILALEGLPSMDPAARPITGIWQ